MQPRRLRRQRGRRLGIDCLDHRDALVADPRDDADGPQQARRVIDQEQEVGDASDPQDSDDQRDELVHRCLLPVERAHRKHERKHEESDAVADDVVAQKRRGDDPGRQLAARDLDRDQQRAEREHEERQRQRDHRLIQRRRARRPEPAPAANPATHRTRAAAASAAERRRWRRAGPSTMRISGSW